MTDSDSPVPIFIEPQATRFFTRSTELRKFERWLISQREPELDRNTPEPSPFLEVSARLLGVFQAMCNVSRGKGGWQYIEGGGVAQRLLGKRGTIHPFDPYGEVPEGDAMLYPSHIPLDQVEKSMGAPPDLLTQRRIVDSWLAFEKEFMETFNARPDRNPNDKTPRFSRAAYIVNRLLTKLEALIYPRIFEQARGDASQPRPQLSVRALEQFPQAQR